MTERITIYTDPETRAWLKALAKDNHRSVNGQIEWILKLARLEQQRKQGAATTSE